MLWCPTSRPERARAFSPSFGVFVFSFNLNLCELCLGQEFQVYFQMQAFWIKQAENARTKAVLAKAQRRLGNSHTVFLTFFSSLLETGTLGLT